MSQLNVNNKPPADYGELSYAAGPIGTYLYEISQIQDPTKQFGFMTQQLKKQQAIWDFEEGADSVLSQFVTLMWPSLLLNFYMITDSSIVLHIGKSEITLTVPAEINSERLDDELVACR